MSSRRKVPKGFQTWIRRLDLKAPGHYEMTYDAADGYTGKQIMGYIDYMKSKGRGSCLIGTDFVYCMLDRIAELEKKCSK